MGSIRFVGLFFEPPELIPRDSQLREQHIQNSGGRPTASFTVVQYHNAALHAKPARDANKPARVRNAVIQRKDRSRHCLISPASHVGNLLLCAKVDRKSTRLNSSHLGISYAVFCLKKK